MNNNFGISPKSYQLIMDCLTIEKEIEKVVLLGSRAMGNYKPGSDIDLAIFGHNVDSKILSGLNSKLNEILPIPYFVDLLLFKNVESEALRVHIIEKGKVIFVR